MLAWPLQRRSLHRIRGARAAALSVGLLAAATAHAASPEAIEVQVVGAPTSRCPSPAVLEEALREVLPKVAIRPGAATKVVLEDRWESYRVEVAGLARDFADPARRCEERARAAAVFVGLALDLARSGVPATPPHDPTLDPGISSPAAPTPPPSPLEPPVAPVVSVSRTASLGVVAAPKRRFTDNLHLELSASGLFAFAPLGADRLGTWGGQGRLVLRYAALGLTLGGGFLQSRAYALASGEPVVVKRYPFDLGLRFHVEWRRLRFVAQGAFVVIPVVAPGNRGVSTSAWEWGGSVGVELRFALVRQLDVFAGLTYTVLGRQAELQDVSSKLPVDAVYPPLAVSLGVAWRIR